ncbi:aldo/keto reductase [Lachnospiraceae bacterium 38-10]
MKTRQLGDLTVSEVGMGCMAFSHGYGKIPPEQYSIEAIQNAYRHGCTLFDTAEIYSPNLAGIGHNERIVGKALKDVRKDVVLATKLFLDKSEARGKGGVYRAIRSHLEDSMDRLRTDMVDLYYLHRTNGGVMIEDVAEAMGLLIEDGLIRGWGLSQVDVDIIDRAQKVTPLSAIQNIYSMVERDMEKAVIPYCMEHGIGVVPFSPIASGLLSGKITTETKFERNDDVRNWVPQLSKANIAGNQPIIDVNIQEECPKTKSEKSRKNLANAEKLRVSGIQTIQKRHSLREEKTGIKQGFNSPYFFVQKIFKKLKA